MDCSIILCTYLAVCPHRRTPPTAPYVANTPALRRSLLAVGASKRAEGQFFYSHHRWRGVHKPSSALLGVVQGSCPDDTHKGRDGVQKLARLLSSRASAGLG